MRTIPTSAKGVTIKRLEKLCARIIEGERGCWEWTGAVSDGYGSLHVPSVGTRRAHRFFYELMFTEIPYGYVADHLCDNRICVNPRHLKITTHRENILRSPGVAATNLAKTHCNRGHEFTPENIYTSPGRPFGRTCRICVRLMQRRRYWENIEKVKS